MATLECSRGSAKARTRPGESDGGDLVRVLHALLDGPLPEEWVSETAGLSGRKAGRMLESLAEHGLVLLVRHAGFGRRVVEYRAGAGNTVRRVLEESGMAGGSRHMAGEGMEAFLRLLGSLARLEFAAGGGNGT